MKNALIIIFLAFSTITSATDYYISSSGNDVNNNGFSPSTPWKTIAKVNSAFSIMKPGDRILFNRGDTFYGTLTARKSGTNGNPITVSAYGTGANPIITGFTNLSGWTNEGGNIYSKVIASPSQTNMVTVNGVQVGMGRFPDSTYLTYESFSTNVSITDVGLGDATNWKGAEAVIRKNKWSIQRLLITDHTRDKFTYTGGGWPGRVNAGYFIENDLRCVTVTNEWYHNTGTGKFYIYGDPSSKTVKVATLDNLFYNNDYDYITIDNISFVGSIGNAVFLLPGSDNCIMQNCSITFAGQDAIRTSGNYGTIDNNSISDCNRCGVYCNGSNMVITNNTIANMGLIKGQASDESLSIGISVEKSNYLVQYNSISSTGNGGILIAAGSSYVTVKNNYINRSLILLDDGGAIYAPGTQKSLLIDGNIILNVVGNIDGAGSPTSSANGIFMDAYANGITIQNNTVANSVYGGIKLHISFKNTITGNTFYNNYAGIDFETWTSTNSIYDIILTGNIFFAKAANQYALLFQSQTTDIPSFGTAGNNYYARPIADDYTFRIYQPLTNYSDKTLAEWQTFTRQDASSHKSIIPIADTSMIDFYYNATKVSKVISLGTSMIDVAGTKYARSITLLPYRSAVLMVDPNPAQTDIPVYISSAIENTTPTFLEMTYSINLANTIPAASAFTVKVNGVNRTTNSVVVSGNKVRLTLASAVVYGEVVTVAYTKPSTNPLQTTSGGQAASFSAQTVSNKVFSPSPVYVSSAIENASSAVLEMTYNLTLANIVPDASAFTVVVNSITTTVKNVDISGTKVLLTLPGSVVYGDYVKVAYTKPSTNPLQSTSGGQAASVSAQTVTNKVTYTRPIYFRSVIENATPAVLEMTYNQSLANVVPVVSAFTVRVNSVTRTVNTVAISGTEVLLSISSPVVYSDVVTVAYTKISTNLLQTTSGALAASIGAQAVTNKVTPSGQLLYVSSAIENTTPSVLEITYNQSLANIVPAASAFTVIVNGVTRTVNTVNISGTEVLLTLVSPIIYDDVVTVAYIKPSTNPLQTTSGAQAASIGAQIVFNKVSPPRPVYVSSAIENATSSVLEMTYNLSMDNIVPDASAFTVMVNSCFKTVNTVAISGTKVLLTLAGSVVYGDYITVAYTKPSTNPLQSTSEGQAASVSAQRVTNKVTHTRPIYVSSAIENATPAVLEMTYNQSLANIAPAASAFIVRVNSVTRTVNTVAIPGTKVLLFLSSPIFYGDVVTVAYTKISTNLLQTTSGGQAASIGAQTVTNKVTTSSQENVIYTTKNATVLNDPPIVVIKNKTNSYSGFVGEIDASDSYDLNNDKLTYEWIVPDNISVSSTSSSKIQFLSPVVNTSRIIEFQVKVNNGRAIVAKSIPINIMPYKPELSMAKITNIKASLYTVPDYPDNIADENPATKWSVNGDNQWLLLKLAEPFNISHLEITFLPGQKYESYFDIFASKDNLIWESILSKVASCNFSGDIQIFDFPATKTETEYSYIKLVGHGNSFNSLNSFSEFKIFGILRQSSDSDITEKRNIVIYPNPVHDFINISIKHSTLVPKIIKIIDLYGHIVFTDLIEQDIENVRIPVNLKPGNYIVTLESGIKILHTQKLIIY